MANVFTAIAPVLYSAAQEVSNEPFGLISAIDTRFDDKGVAIGDSVSVPVAPTLSASAYTPAMTTTAGSDATATAVAVQITNNSQVSWHLTGEQMTSLRNGGDNFNEWVRQMVAQGMRTLRNEAESAAWTEVYQSSSRAYGTAGTTPFASNLAALTNARKILQDNGAPLADLQFVCDSSAGLNLRNLGIIQQADQAGTAEERRNGVLLRQFGFAIRESAAVSTHTKGDGALYDTDLVAGWSVGDTSIHVDTGTGAILAGDVITFAGDTNKYVVNTGFAGDGDGDIVLGRPGLQAALADGVDVTIGNTYTANLAFERNAVVGVMRPPLIPPSPVISQMPISDGRGMTYLLVEVVGDGMITWRLHLASGFKVVQEEHVATVLG